ncbi:hypothetical protein HER10_EVM0007789 [Colletotrichum scovillei]|uniref:uncharacterized protein n=1 Tax=Colletotrichum scovillei TaxID=1209932 RepID=UPI0015C3AE6C|nr:uncharacterized protein HER10_EVM0007789 [Colletotrichum scovillei]KAF4779923.1 hypothetical protein HER10_EVM0007789 [Colletotrichum scovillei]
MSSSLRAAPPQNSLSLSHFAPSSDSSMQRNPRVTAASTGPLRLFGSITTSANHANLMLSNCQHALHLVGAVYEYLLRTCLGAATCSRKIRRRRRDEGPRWNGMP